MDNSPRTRISNDNEFDTTGLILAFLANWKWFAISIVACIIAAFFYIASRIPTYRIESSIYLSQDYSSASNTFNMSNAEDPMVAFKSFIDETELEVLKSRNNVIKLVDSLGLAYSYYEEGALRDKPLYQNNAVSARADSLTLRNLKAPVRIEVKAAGDGKYDVKVATKFNEVSEKHNYEGVALPFAIELSQGVIELSHSPVMPPLDYTEKIVVQNPRIVADRLSKSLAIEFAKNSEKIIRVSVNTNDPKLGADIINLLVEFYNRDIIEDKNRSAVQTEAFIIDRLVMISDELRDVENRLQAYRQQHNVTNIEAQSALNLNRKSEYDEQMAQVEADMQIIAEIERLVSIADTYQTLPAAISDQTVSTIIEAYNKKVNNLNRTLEGSTPDNPLVISMRDELSRDKVRVLQNLSTAKRNLTTKRNAIKRLENVSAGQLASTPTIDKGFNEIFREQQVKVNIYTFLLQRREEIALQKTLATNTARLIDDPVGDKPVSPKKILIYLLAVIMGVLIPACIITLRRLMFPYFSDQQELERLTDVPILGEICVNKDNKNIVVDHNVSTSIAELFRLLRNSISFTRSGVDSRVILVTSSVSGEGKTFIAANLAMTYALMGKKVAVIGLDLRRPMLAHSFGFDNSQGVTSYLCGHQTDLSKLIHRSNENPNLYVLTAGPVPPNPNELLMSDKMDQLMHTLRDQFDYIILDTAPIGVISDTFLIVRYSDLQLYVTRANYSTRNSLKVLHDAIKSDKFSSVYMIINGVDMATNSYQYRRYGEYGHYKNQPYQYGYGSKKKS